MKILTLGHEALRYKPLGREAKGRRKKKNTGYNIITTTTITTRGREGVRKGRFQQQDDNTLRDRRKGDPKHECCGKTVK